MGRALPPLLLAALTAAPLAAAPATAVLLPFENVSGVEGARNEVAALVASGLGAKGYAVVRGGPVEAFLERERIRHLDSLGPEARARLLKEFGACCVVSGSVYVFADGPNPIVALQARMLREGSGIPWWSAIGLMAYDTEGMLGLGRAASLEALAAEATRRLLHDVPEPGRSASLRRPHGKPFRLSGPRTYRAAALGKGRVERVCLLPLENATPAREASKTLGQLLARQLVASGSFDVVEPAELRTAMVAERVRSFRDLDPDTLKKLGARLGTTAFLRGTLYTYRDATARAGRVSPQVALELSLVDVGDGRVLWTSQHSRSGDDYEFLLRRGAVSTATALADRMLGEMVAAFDSAEPAKAAPSGPPRPVLTTDTHAKEPKKP